MFGLSIELYRLGILTGHGERSEERERVPRIHLLWTHGTGSSSGERVGHLLFASGRESGRRRVGVRDSVLR